MKPYITAIAAMLVFPAQGLAAELTVQPVTITDQKAVYGTVESVKTTPARARVDGTIESLNVKEGDIVESGQVLAKIFDAKLKPKLDALDSRIESLKSEQALAKTELERTQTLIKSGAESRAFLDKAKARHESVTGALNAAIAERAVIAQQYVEADVLAPTDGRVLKVNAVNGTIVRPGETVAEIATSASVLRLMLPERHARFIKTGDNVMIGERGDTDESNPPKYEGRISLVYPELQEGRVVADVQADGLGGYFVGERARVYIGTGARKTFILPENYLVHRFGLTFVRFKDGREIPVQTVQTHEDCIEILAGLKAGDVVVKP
jgi:RND family efflux transporter MFP subunit